MEEIIERQEDLVCTHCGRPFKGDPSEPDPYQAEVNDDHTPVPLCPECWVEACEDI